MNWISVKDKLPELDQGVLVYSYEDKINQGQYVAWINSLGIENKPIWQYSYCCGCLVSYKVTHWMPLVDNPIVEDDKC
jgi:hypothetical protein